MNIGNQPNPFDTDPLVDAVAKRITVDAAQ